MNIKNFNPGDIIVRVENGEMKQSGFNENLGIATEVIVYSDSSYIGEPMKLLDVCNGVVYVEKIGVPVMGDGKRELPLNVFAQGWEYFVVPNGYTMQEFENKKVV